MRNRLKQIYVPGAGVFEGQTLELNAAADEVVFGRRVHAEAAAAPAVGNDDTQGYAPGSIWIRLDTDEAWICVDASTGAAVWREIALGGNPYQEPQTTENITNTDTTLADAFTAEPISDASVRVWLNGIFQRQGAGESYTVDHAASPPSIKWLALTGTAVDMDTDDELEVAYESYA